MLRNLGIDHHRTARTLRGLGAYRANKQEFKRQEAASEHKFLIEDYYPCPGDRHEAGGVASGQYFHQDLYVAQRIFAARPERHVDVGSRVDGFVAHVAAFRPIDVLDIRPIHRQVRNMTFHQRDIMETDPAWDGITDSLSCLHTLEHFGLGRYGDPIDYYGYRRGWQNLARMVKPDGTLYLSVPASERQRIEFDAHRIFNVPHILEMIGSDFTVEALAYVDDAGDLHDADVTSPEAKRTFGLEHGCVIFTLRRL